MAGAFSYRIGRVFRAHGLRGELAIQLFRRRAIEPDWKSGGHQPIALDDRPFQIAGVRSVAPDRLVMRLVGIDDRESAEAVEGAFLDVDPNDLPSLITDASDRMFGREVIDRSGARIGEVIDIRDTGGQVLLVVGEEEILIPAPFVIEIRDHQIVIDPPEGLLELNTKDPS